MNLVSQSKEKFVLLEGPQIARLIVYAHCTGLEPGQVQGTGLGAIGPYSSILYRNVQTGLRQGQEPDPLSAIVLVQFPLPVQVPFLCSVYNP